MRKLRYSTVLLLIIGATLAIVRSGAVPTGAATAAGGPRPHSTFQFPQVIRDQVARADRSGKPLYARYMTVSDDSGSLVVDLPAAWDDLETGHWFQDGKLVGHMVGAAHDYARFAAKRSEPGVFIGVRRAPVQADGVLALLDRERPGLSRECRHGGRFKYEDAFYTGSFDFYTACVKGAPNVIVVAARPGNQGYSVLMRIVVHGKADLAAAARILGTFQVVSDGLDHHHDGE